jgi:hypothetical protein
MNGHYRTDQYDSDPDDVPVIQLATGPHGSPANPHVVSSARVLDCPECGERLAAVLLDRLRVALPLDAEARAL